MDLDKIQLQCSIVETVYTASKSRQRLKSEPSFRLEKKAENTTFQPKGEKAYTSGPQPSDQDKSRSEKKKRKTFCWKIQAKSSPYTCIAHAIHDKLEQLKNLHMNLHM